MQLSQFRRNGDVAVARVTLEVRRDEKRCSRRRVVFVLGAASGRGCAEGLRRPHCGFFSGGPASRDGEFSPLSQPETWNKGCFGYLEHAMSR